MIPGIRIPHHARCPECGRKFDLREHNQAEEFYFGHDCEGGTTE